MCLESVCDALWAKLEGGCRLIWDLAFKPCHDIASFFRFLLVDIAAKICASSSGAVNRATDTIFVFFVTLDLTTNWQFEAL